MAKLYFKVASDWEEVVRLRNEIVRLKQELKNMDSTQAPATFNALNAQLSASTQRMDELVTEAAKAGAVMEGNFKKKIFDASQTVNGFTEKIIAQKAVVKDVEADVKRLGEAYRTALKRNPLSANNKLADYTSAKKALDEDKAALFDLTQQQAEARLSLKKLRDEYALYKNNGKDVVDSNNQMALSFKKTLAAIGGTAVIKKFISDVVRVRGEFQQLDVAFTTLLQSKEKANALMAQMVKTAAETPFSLTEVASGARQLIAYGFQAEQVNDTLIRLGNIASGLGLPLERLTYLYGTTMTQGRLYARDLMQFTTSGIPMLQGLADMYGVTTDKVNEMVSAGKIGFPEVKKVIENLTNEGGKFFNLMQEQSKTITGKISNLGDAWDDMLNKIGKSQEGVINSSIDSLKYLVENYETVGKVLTGLIVTYGAYKAALVINIALEKVQAAQRLASIKGVTTMKVITDMLTGSVSKLNIALSGKGFALIGGAAIASSLLLLDWANEQDKCTKAIEKFNDEQKASSEAEKKRAQIVRNAISMASDEKRTTDERINAIGVLKQMYKNIIPEYEKETFLLKNIADYKNKINEADERNKRIGVKTKIVMLDKDIAKYESGLREANKQGAGQATQGIMNTLNNLKKERELYSNLLNDIEKEQITATTNPKSEIKNKSYWENQKKNAKSVLESIASSQKQLMDAGVFKGIDAATVKSYKDNVKLLKEAEKELKVYDSSTKQDKEAEKLRHQQQKSSEELLALRRKNQQDEIDLMEEGREKKLKQIDADFEARKAEINKKVKELVEVNKKTGLSELNTNGLTDTQQAEIDKANKLNADSRTKAERDMYKVEAEAMRNYLKDYGTFQQQKLAVAEEYAEKIRNAQNEGERSTLEKQRDAALQQVEVKAIKQSVDWGSVFGEFGAMFKDQLQPTIDKLKSIAQSDEFKSSSLQDQQTLYELISKLEQSNAAWDSDIFQKVSDDMVAYQSAMQNHLKAQERERLATEALARAKRDLEVAERNGNGIDALNAQSKVTEAQLALNAAAQDVQDFGAQVQEATSNLQASSAQAVNMFQNLESGLKGLTSGSLQGVGQGLMQLDKLFNKGGITKDVGNALASGLQSLLGKDSKASKAISEALGSAGMAGEIISGVLGILDLLKDGFSNILVSLQNTVFGAVEGILNDVFSGDIIVKPLENSVKHIGNILSTITFGGLGGLFDGADYSGYENMKSQYENLISIWDELIDKKMQYIDIDYGTEALKAAEEAQRLVNIQISRQRQLIKELASSGASKGSHSLGYRIDHRLSKEDYQRLSNLAGQKITAEYQLWDLSPEQIEKILSDEKLVSVLDTVNKDFVTYLQNIVEYGEKLDEITERTKEAVTGMSFDEFRSGYAGLLSDLDSTNEDFADNFEKYLQQAIFESLLANEYKEQIQKLYDTWAEYGKDGLSSDEARLLRNMQQELTNGLLAKRDELMNDFGWNSSSTSQSSTSKGFQTMSQDTGEELNGRFTALQIAGEEIKNQSVLQTQSLNLLTVKADAIFAINTEMKNIADETRDLIANSYLELVQISENTGNSAKYLKDIKADIAEVKKNTSKL